MAHRTAGATDRHPAYPSRVSLRVNTAASRETALDLGPLRVVLERIVAAWQPEQIWLFGSRARGTATPASDWDLLVVVADEIDEAEVDPVAAWRLGKGSGIHVEIVPCRARDFLEDRTTPNTLAFEAATRALLVHVRHHVDPVRRTVKGAR